jgi:hypothetical protein
MPTWGGAPELEPAAVLSDPTVERVAPPEVTKAASAPEVAEPALVEPPRATTRTGDHAPPVQKTTPPAAGGRTRTVLVAAIIAGVLAGVGIFAVQRGGARPSQKPVAPVLSAQPVASSAPAPMSAAPIDAPAPSSSDSASPMDSSVEPPSASGAPAASGGRKSKRLCKPAGQKCFSNDDCCDRTCRKWVCQANAALHDPYGGEEK